MLMKTEEQRLKDIDEKKNPSANIKMKSIEYIEEEKKTSMRE
jgi:hypothetical protein